MRDVTTPEVAEVNTDDDYKSVLRAVVLPLLGCIAIAAVSLAILYAFCKHFKQKRKAKETQDNHP
jgi:O-antigen/teichoic acid export membrane protein